MSRRCQALWTPRRGHRSEEYEDAFAINEASGRFAMADGASEGCFTGLWAKLLVNHFVRDSVLPVEKWTRTLTTPQEQWNENIHANALPWYAEDGVEQGAFAAFLGLVFTQESVDGLSWQATAIGDVCLFHTRQKSLLKAFPIDRSVHFNNFPVLIGSCSPTETIQKKQQLWNNGRGQTGDRLWIMTDALASWCLMEIEANRSPWHDFDSALSQSPPQDAFTTWIESLRDHGQLRNDDVTLMLIEL
ncbi:MAG: hypothetical protein LLF97_06975 [Planctomycetaceae bacterium]|nr:hypothetical protein [Planctomycetaceae bacterium]